jgi:hypothetical protein
LKKLIIYTLISLTGILILTNCQKNSQNDNLNAALAINQKSLTNDYNSSKIYNDSVGHYYVNHTSIVSGTCRYYDSLYHRSDTLFTTHYNMCMQINGGMMSGGGMMGNNHNSANNYNYSSMMDNMNQLRANHHIYHQ